MAVDVPLEADIYGLRDIKQKLQEYETLKKRIAVTDCDMAYDSLPSERMARAQFYTESFESHYSKDI